MYVLACLAHASGKSVQRAHQGITDEEVAAIRECSSCVQSKFVKRSFKVVPASVKALIPSEVVSAHILASTAVSVGGHKYLLVLVDQSSGFLEIYAQTHKNPTSGSVSIPHFVRMCKNAFGVNIKTLRADLGSEFVTNELKQLCTEQGIRQEFASTAAPQQNGQVEHANRTIGEGISTMLLDSGVHRQLWAEAVSMFVYVKNLLPRPELGGRTPWSVFTGKPEPPLPQHAFGVNIKTLRADLGSEFVTNELKQLCGEQGIRQEFASTAAPQQNGQVESADRTIGEGISTMLLDSGVHKQFWAEAASMFVYVKNLLPR